MAKMMLCMALLTTHVCIGATLAVSINRVFAAFLISRIRLNGSWMKDDGCTRY